MVLPPVNGRQGSKKSAADGRRLDSVTPTTVSSTPGPGRQDSPLQRASTATPSQQQPPPVPTNSGSDPDSARGRGTVKSQSSQPLQPCQPSQPRKQEDRVVRKASSKLMTGRKTVRKVGSERGTSMSKNRFNALAMVVADGAQSFKMAIRAKQFEIGERVRVRNEEKDAWLVGTISQMCPLLIRQDGSDQQTGPWKIISKVRHDSIYQGGGDAWGERCSRCTMDAVWIACDVFWEIDTRHTGFITRAEYIIRLAELPSVMRLRMVRRARLEARFRNSAKAVSLEEFLRLIWPAADEADLRLMRRWCQLRESRSVLHDGNFRGVENELRRVFDLLDGSGQGFIFAMDVIRAHIMTWEDMERLTKRTDIKSHRLDMDAFRGQLGQHLKTEYVTSETMSRIKKEEEAPLSGTFQSAFHLGDKK